MAMSSFPLAAIPYNNILTVLGKMSFEESTRMRRTCRDIDEAIDNSRKLVFPLPVKERKYRLWIAWNGNAAVDTNIDPILLWRDPFGWGKVIFNPEACETEEMLMAYPRYIKGAMIEKVKFSVNPWMGHTITDTFHLIPYFKEARIKCRLLKIECSDIKAPILVSLVEILQPRKIILRNYGRFPIAFSLLEKISPKCKNVTIHCCDELSPVYPEILSQFEAVEIVDVENRSFSVAPLLQLWLKSSSSPLTCFQLPFYEITFLTTDEIESLDLEKWRIRRAKGEGGFVVDTGSEFITVTGKYGKYGVRSCIGRRIPKTDIASLVSHWVFLDITMVPFDVSDFHDYIADHLDDWMAIKNYIEPLSSVVSSIYSDL